MTNGRDDLIDAVKRQIEERRTAVNSALTRVYDSHRGAPVPVVAEALRKELTKAGMNDLSDEWVAPYAETISDGRRIEVR